METGQDLKMAHMGEQDGEGVGGRGVHPFSQMHQECTFSHRTTCRTPSQGGQGYLTNGKEYIEPHKTPWDEGTRGKKQESYQDWTCPQVVGELKQRSDPHIGATVLVRGDTFKAE